MFGWLKAYFTANYNRPLEIVIDARGAWRDLGSGQSEQVRRDELKRVEIMTTDEGPFVEDVFWLLDAGDHGCVIPGEFGNQILDHIGDCPGIDHEAVIKAMGCTEDDRFVVWSRDAPAYSRGV